MNAIVPADFEVPRELVTERFRLEPLGPQHNVSDHAAWTGSVAHIRATPGFVGRSWPPDEMSLEDNLRDLQAHADDFEKRNGFTFTVLEGTEVIGCLYIYPNDEEIVARSWVRADRADLDKALYEAVHAWLTADWPFEDFTYAPR